MLGGCGGQVLDSPILEDHKGLTCRGRGGIKLAILYYVLD